MLPLRGSRAQQIDKLDPEDYKVVWIAPLEIEARAALLLLDQRHRGKFAVNRGDDYVFHAGSMCGHNIVIATLPAGQEYGTGSAAALASQVKKFFPNLWFGLLVGVAAGLPDLTRKPPRDIRLGDVLVGLPKGDSAGLVAYDLGKETEDGFQQLRGGHALAMTEPIVRSAIGSIKLEAPNDTQSFLPYYETIRDEEHASGTFADLGQDADILYSIGDDGTDIRVQRTLRPEPKRTRVWYGSIGSGEKLFKNVQKRNELRDKYDLIGLEMEAAGTMNRIPVGVIRGVCDYGDVHKNKEWQPYAAAMAAAYAKAVLAEIMPASEAIVERSVGRRVVASETAHRSCYYIPLSDNARFTGRTAILNTLEDKLFHQQQPCQRTALVGLGGAGKTQVALHFAYHVKDTRPEYSIFWLPILSDGSVAQAYVEIAEKIGLQKSSADEDIKLLVCQHLNSGKAGKWLLVVDNADDQDLVFGSDDTSGFDEFLPKHEDGLILLTTRSRQIAEEFAQSDIIDVEQMDKEEAARFLKKSLSRKQAFQNEEIVAELLSHLTYLPLAIAQAAAYLNQTNMPMQKYLALLRGSEKEAVKVLGREFKDSTRYRSSRNAIATTWLVTFDQIQKSDETAVDLLSFMSCIEPKAIPQSILPGQESEELEWAIGMLCGYSFLTRRGESDTFDMHSLVHMAMRGWIEKQSRQEEIIKDAIGHLDDVFPSYNRANRELWREYTPHALRALARTDGDQTVQRAGLYMNVGLCLSEDRRFKEAITCLKQTYLYRKAYLVQEDESRLRLEHELARAYLSDRRIKDAIKMLEHVVAVEKTILDEKDESRLVSELLLARAYHADRRTKEATKILEHIVAVREETLDEEDYERLASEHALASAYVSDRRVKDGIEILEHIVAVGKATLDEEDHDRLASEHELARAYLTDLRIKDGIKILEHVVAVEKTTLDEEDYERLVSEHELAKAYVSDRRIKDGIKILEHVVAVRNKTLEEEDYERLKSEYELAGAYLSDRRIKDAIKIFEHVVAVEKTTLDENDHERLSSEHSLAKAYLDNGHVQKAIDLLEHVVAIERELFEEDDPNRHASFDLLAKAYQQLESEWETSEANSDGQE